MSFRRRRKRGHHVPRRTISRLTISSLAWHSARSWQEAAVSYRWYHWRKAMADSEAFQPKMIEGYADSVGATFHDKGHDIKVDTSA